MREAPLLRIELVLLLLGLSLVVPRLAGVGPRVLLADGPQESDRVAVGYARHRLWSDFQSQMQNGQESSPERPGLSDYRTFLADLGLKDRGDVTSLFVWPRPDARPQSDQIDVQLSETGSPIVLGVFVADSLGRRRWAGKLEIREDSEDAVTCSSETQSAPGLLALWPLRPTPLLP